MNAEGTRRRMGYAALWLLVAAVCVAIGVLAVNVVGAGLRDRGPIGSESLVPREDPTSLPVDPDDPTHAKTIRGEFGEFDVRCQGVVIRGEKPRPAKGWRTVTYEDRPDDDVDAVFESRTQVIEIEVYCNGGRPTIAEQEIGTRPDDEGDGDGGD